MDEQLDLVVESMVLKLPNCSCPYSQQSVPQRRRLKYTHSANNVVEVPHLLEDGAVLATSEVGNGTGLGLECVLDLGKRVRGLVRREYPRSTYIQINKVREQGRIQLITTHAASMS